MQLFLEYLGIEYGDFILDEKFLFCYFEVNFKDFMKYL